MFGTNVTSPRVRVILEWDEKHVDCTIKAPKRNADGVTGIFGAHFPEWFWGNWSKPIRSLGFIIHPKHPAWTEYNTDRLWGSVT